MKCRCVLKLIVLSACIASFVACGDESTNVTEVTEQTGISVLAKGEKLTECGSENTGDMLYVTDSTAVYYCADGKWSMLNAKDGANCSAKKVKDGVEVSCGGQVIDTLKNATAGKNCSVKANADGESFTISCEGSEDVIVKNGTSGDNCIVAEYADEESNGNGYEIVCGGVRKGIVWNGTETPMSSSATESSSSEAIVEVKTDNYYKSNCPVGKYCSYVSTEYLNADKTYGEILDPRDYQVYKTITIEKDNYKVIWMAQNLNYNNGNSISYCYQNKADNCDSYGRLYQWSAAGKACPNGWHLPNNDEWEALFFIAGGNSFAGKFLKASKGWYSGNGSDFYGIALIPAGFRSYNSEFGNATFNASFWSSTEGSESAYRYSFEDSRDDVQQKNYSKSGSFSVRCVMDQASE